jgi:hypothetical protein
MDHKVKFFPIVSDGNAIRATGAGMSFIMHASIGVWTLLHVVWTVDGKGLELVKSS